MYNDMNVRFGYEASHVMDVIDACGELLLKNSLISNEYIDSMKHTLEKFGPYMVLIKDVALFHGVPGVGVLDDGICLVHLQNRIELDQTNKSIKLAFAFCSKDGETHMEIIKDFATMLMDQDVIAKLINAETKDELLILLNGGTK